MDSKLSCSHDRQSEVTDEDFLSLLARAPSFVVAKLKFDHLGRPAFVSSNSFLGDLASRHPIG